METSDRLDKGFLKNLKYDLPASVVVFLVAVPLCLGIALASGAPLFSGIIAGIVGGIIVGVLSGSPLGVSGPAAGLAVIVLGAINELGAFPVFLSAVVLAGVIQLAFGFLKAGVIGYYFPSSVIKGMLAGIGVIIVLKQIPHAVGYDKDYEGSLSFAQPDGHNTLSELYYMLSAISPGAVIIAAACLAILILWEQPFMKRQRVFQIVQGPLVAVVAGVVLNLVFASFPNLALRTEQIVQIPVAESIGGFFGQFTFPDFGQVFNPQVLIIAVTLAVVASLETLLCLEATDKLDPFKRISPANRELKAQGVGNIISGLVGGLPVTQVIVRSSTNIQSGGRTKASAIMHGIVLLGAAMLVPHVLNLIPLASLAAILFVVGYKLAKPSLVKSMYRQGWEQFVPFVVTVVGIVLTDLLVGIGIGMVVAIVYILYKNYRKPYAVTQEDDPVPGTIRIELSEDVTFLNKAGIMRTLDQIPDGNRVVIDASKTMDMHQDVVEIIDDFRESARYRDLEVEYIKRNHWKAKIDPMRKFEKLIQRQQENDESVMADVP